MLEAQAERLLERRRGLVAEIARIKVERTQREAKLAAAEKNAASAFGEAEVRYRAAEADWRAAISALFAASVNADRQIALLEAELGATSDPAIAELYSHLLDLQAEVMKGSLKQVLTREKRNPYSLKQLTQVFSNWPDLRDRQARILAALRAIDALRLEALTRQELEERIRRMLEEINQFPADSVKVQFEGG